MPPPRAAAQASTSTPKRSSRFLTATRPPDSAKTNTPTRSRASCAGRRWMSMRRGKRYLCGVVAVRARAGGRWQSLRHVAASHGTIGRCRTCDSIGVHEDGQHLLLADDEGDRFRVPLDEPLRAAVRRDRPRLGQLQIEIDGGLRPRTSRR